MELRASGVMFSMRFLPLFFPPQRPSADMTLDISSLVGGGSGSVVDRLTSV